MKTSHLESELAFQLRAEGITDFETEVRFVPSRRWRADIVFFSPDGERPGLLVEVQGGVYSGGRHSAGRGQERDFEKLNAAQIDGGFMVLQFGPSQIRSGEALDTIKRALGNIEKERR